MRVDIKTKGRIKDRDIKALYLINAALKMSTPRMIDANLRFAIESFKTKKNKS